MTPAGREAAATLLHQAAESGARLAALPAGSKPASVDEAHAIQDALTARSGRAIAGWKVATDASGTVMRGAIYADDCFPTPARVAAARFPLMGVEGEIAYRFLVDVPRRAQPYSVAEIQEMLEPFPAIEIVDSRFESYQDTPSIDRLADRMSNGGFVIGRRTGSLEAGGLDRVHVRLLIDGRTGIDQVGGHVRGDPLLPAIDLIHLMQAEHDFTAGQFITTGTFTGLTLGAAGQHFAVVFEQLGEVELTLE